MAEWQRRRMGRAGSHGLHAACDECRLQRMKHASGQSLQFMGSTLRARCIPLRHASWTSSLPAGNHAHASARVPTHLPALHLAKAGHDRQVERDQAAHRVARQAKHQQAPAGRARAMARRWRLSNNTLSTRRADGHTGGWLAPAGRPPGVVTACAARCAGAWSPGSPVLLRHWHLCKGQRLAWLHLHLQGVGRWVATGGSHSLSSAGSQGACICTCRWLGKIALRTS